MTPAVLTDVPANSSVATDEEIFGPVFPVIGFDTLEEAIEIANRSQYGLSSGILTKNTKIGTCHKHKIVLTLGERSICLATELNLVVLNPFVFLAQLGLIALAFGVFGQ